MEDLQIIIKPQPKQADAYRFLFDPIHFFVIFGGGSGGGKSWLGCEWLMQMCYRFPGSKWFIGRNQLTRLMGSSYITFLKVCDFYGIPKEDWSLNGQYHYIQFTNGSRIDLIDLAFLPSDPMYQRFGSFEYTGGWIEEGGEVNFAAFDVLKTRVGRWHNKEWGLNPPKILITCNPEQNWLYRLVYKPFKKGTLSAQYAFVQSLYGDNEFTRVEYGAQLQSITDPILRKRLMLGLWEYEQDDSSLIQYDAILDMFTNTPIHSDHKFLTADIARYGSDKIVYGLWRGMDLYQVISKTKQGIDVTANDIRTLLQFEHIPYSHAVVDDDGVGGGVVDSLRGVKGFVGNAAALPRIDGKTNVKENYRNLRSQCSYMAAEKINAHAIGISAKLEEGVKELIIEDLQHIKRKNAEQEGPLQIIPKDEIKEAIGRSPDHGDMIVMRMYFELDKPVVYHQPPMTHGVRPFMPGIG